MDSPERTLVIGCGALAHELLAVMRASLRYTFGFVYLLDGISFVPVGRLAQPP